MLSKNKGYVVAVLFALVLLIIWLLTPNPIEAPLNNQPLSITPVLDTLPEAERSNSHPIEFDKPSYEAVSQQVDKPNNKKVQNVISTEDLALIAEIDKDMQLTLPPAGDLSYMSPESETLQPTNPEFPVKEPENSEATLGQEANENQQLGSPFEGE
ncbi:hypothetical protein [Paraglaciecola sp. L3A3]|uniref:hypothetical protein n=1 Tax=Paraglaciecola sp. L3A3 TaxID=2686358 RepID=UPI00131BFA4C|nr:hypothetical protein [Paraglaciecola sp. L3A3]